MKALGGVEEWGVGGWTSWCCRDPREVSGINASLFRKEFRFYLIKFLSMFEIICSPSLSLRMSITKVCAPPVHAHNLVGLQMAAVPPPHCNGFPGIQLWQRCLTHSAVPYIMTRRCPAPLTPPPWAEEQKARPYFTGSPDVMGGPH